MQFYVATFQKEVGVYNSLHLICTSSRLSSSRTPAGSAPNSQVSPLPGGPPSEPPHIPGSRGSGTNQIREGTPPGRMWPQTPVFSPTPERKYPASLRLRDPCREPTGKRVLYDTGAVAHGEMGGVSRTSPENSARTGISSKGAVATRHASA